MSVIFSSRDFFQLLISPDKNRIGLTSISSISFENRSFIWSFRTFRILIIGNSTMMSISKNMLRLSTSLGWKKNAFKPALTVLLFRNLCLRSTTGFFWMQVVPSDVGRPDFRFCYFNDIVSICKTEIRNIISMLKLT